MRINISPLVERRNQVDPYLLLCTADTLYTDIKTFGIENLQAYYHTKHGIMSIDGIDISPVSLAIADLVVRLIYRWDDYQSGRLEHHFNLDTISLEAVLEDSKFFNPTSFDINLRDLLTVSQILGRKRCLNNSVIDVTPLILLADSKQPVNPWDLITSVDEFYRGIKAMGINNLRVCYQKENKYVECIASTLSEYSRGIANLIARLIYRWNNYQSGRLEARFGLSTPIEELLSNLACFKPSSFGKTINEMITVSDIINSVSDSKFIEEVCINITDLHQLTQNHKIVDSRILMSECDAFYRGIKAVGIENLKVYYTENGKKVSIPASSLPEFTRAIANLIVRIKYRFNDYDSMRLEKRFGLETHIQTLLIDLKCFKPLSYESTMEKLTVVDIINNIAN